MSGLIVLALLAFLCAKLITRALEKLHIPVSSQANKAIIVVFILAALLMWTSNHG